jgi:hypothetical protein
MCTMTMNRPPTRTKPARRERPMPRPREDSLSAAQRRRVKRVRAALRSGAYENALKLDVAADRLLDVLLSSPPPDKADPAILAQEPRS